MYKQIISCLFLLVTVCSCSNDDGDYIPGGEEMVTLKIESSYTFKVGDAVGVFVEKRSNAAIQSTVGESNYKTNIQWVYQENGDWLPASADDMIYTPEDGMPLDLYAYYPYTAQGNANEVVISSATPVMTGKALQHTGTDITLTLQNKTSLLKVVVPDADILSIAEVTLIDVLAGGVISPDKLGTEEDFTASITKSNQQIFFENGYFVAYLPEQTIQENMLFVEVKENDTTIDYITTEVLDISSSKENQLIIQKPVDNLVNLPNTYMLTRGNELFISVQKAYKMWQENSLLAATSPDLNGEVSAEVIWEEDLQDVIESVEVLGTGENAIIYIKTKPGKVGNAIVGVKIGEMIRWSWQVWVSDYNPLLQENGITYSYNGLTFMDRNLGATVDPKSGGDRTFGFFYQWGRKDPFPMRGNLQTLAVTTEVAVNLANSIMYPDNFITATASPNDWYAKTVNQGLDRWNSEDGKKTVFDPCPKGWRVPATNSEGESPWSGLPLPEDENKWGNGWYFEETPTLGYYPAGGQLTAAAASSYTGSAGYYHTAVAGSTMRIDFTSIDLSFGGGRAAARSIRCVKEQFNNQ